MRRKVQTGMLKAAFFAAFGAIGSALGLRAETYYWTGAVDNALSQAGNWSLTDGGSAAGKAPGQGDTVIFNNTEDLSLAKSAHVRYLRYFFNGADVSIPTVGTYRHYGYGGGGITVTGTGTHTFTYPLELNATQFAGEDKTFVVDVAEGASVVVNKSGTTKIYSPAHFIKRGGGTYKTTQFVETKSATVPRGDLTFEAGVLTTERPDARTNFFGTFTVTGPAAKQFIQDAMNVWIDRYVETKDASQTMTFNTKAGNNYNVELQGARDVPRFSALVSGDYSTSNTLKWNPDADDCTITMVDRVWASPRGGISVARGTMRFAEGAGIRQLDSLSVSRGATLEIAQDASPDFSGAPIALAEGATLKVEGACHFFCPMTISYGGTDVPKGVYAAGDFDWLTGDGYLVVAPATRPALTLYWTGAAGETTPKLTTAANWRCADGSQVATVLDADTLVFTNETALAFASENLSLKAGRTVVKRGAGKLTVKQVLPATSKDVSTGGELVFEAGVLTTPTSALPSDRNNYFGALTVKGSAPKTLHLSALSANVRGYTETPDASKALTFDRSYGNNYDVNLVCTGDVARFSADLKVTASLTYTSLLRWNPTGDYAITMVDRVWDTDFGVEVGRGTMRFADGAGFARLSHGLTVKGGAKVEIAASAGSFTGDFVLTMEKGSTLELEADKSVPAVTYDGTAVPDGIYEAASLDWLAGTGRLVVGTGSPAETVTASWTGNGDGFTITDPANWGEPGATELPDFASGKLVAVFPANGAVTIPNGASWNFKGIVVDPNGAKGDELRIVGEGEMRVGAEGLVSRGPGGVTIGVKTSVVSSNPWKFGTVNGGGSLVFVPSAEVVTIADAVWTVHSEIANYGGKGDGPFLKLQCSNPNLKDSYFKIPVQVSADAALGGADSVAKIDCSIKSLLALELTSCHLLNKRVSLEEVQSVDYLRALKSTGFVEIDGELHFSAKNGYFWFSSFPSVVSDVLTVRGGWRTISSTGLSRASEPFSDGYKVLVETVLNANKFWLSRWGWFYVDGEIDVPGGFFIGDGACLHLEENAFFRQGTDRNSVAGVGFTRSPDSTKDPGTLDLQGHDATIQILAGEGAGIVTSEETATLTLNANTEFVTPQYRGWEAEPTFSTQIGSGTSAPDRIVDIKDIQQTDYVSFRGCAKFVKRGALPHWTGGVSTSTGTVTVDEGVLTFKDGAKWRTTPSVTVSGTGVLGIEGDRPFSGKTDLVVTGATTDRIRIAAGKKLVVKSLTVNGEPQASVPDGLVTGGGVLQIGSDGMVLLLR